MGAGFADVRRSVLGSSPFDDETLALADNSSASAQDGHAGAGTWSLFIEAYNSGVDRAAEAKSATMGMTDWLHSFQRAWQQLMPQSASPGWAVAHAVKRVLTLYKSVRERKEHNVPIEEA